MSNDETKTADMLLESQTVETETSVDSVTAEEIKANEKSDESYCEFHKSVVAENRCSLCGRSICQTCTFDYPNGLLLCTECATSPNSQNDINVSTGPVWGSILLGIMAGLLFMFLMFSFSDVDIDENAKGLDLLFSIPLYMSLAGVVIGVLNLKKHKSRPMFVWFAVGINSLVLGLFTLTSIVGLFFV